VFVEKSSLFSSLQGVSLAGGVEVKGTSLEDRIVSMAADVLLIKQWVLLALSLKQTFHEVRRGFAKSVYSQIISWVKMP
jgi:hypothetical protein